MEVKYMNATEVMERNREMSEQLGLVFGRLQEELLTPFTARCVALIERDHPEWLREGK